MNVLCQIWNILGRLKALEAGGGGGGTGTVTSVSVVTANGVSGSVATPTTTPAITLTLGAIIPASVAATGNVTGANLSGTNTGDQTTITGNAGTATALQTARTINGVSFNGTANILVPSVSGFNNIVAETTTARTIGLSDADKYIRCSNAGTVTITIPTNAVTPFPIGTEIIFRRLAGAGAFALSFAGVTVNNSALAATIAAQGNFFLKYVGGDEWDLG